MKVTRPDDRRRLVMRCELAPNSAVMVVIPVIEALPRDPEWEAVEARLTAHCNRIVAPVKE